LEHKSTITVHKPTYQIHKLSVQVVKTTTPVDETITQVNKSMTQLDKPTIPDHKPLDNKSLVFSMILRPIFSSKWIDNPRSAECSSLSTTRGLKTYARRQHHTGI